MFEKWSKNLNFTQILKNSWISDKGPVHIRHWICPPISISFKTKETDLPGSITFLYMPLWVKKMFIGTLNTFNGQKGQIGVTWLSAYKIIWWM